MNNTNFNGNAIDATPTYFLVGNSISTSYKVESPYEFMLAQLPSGWDPTFIDAYQEIYYNSSETLKENQEGLMNARANLVSAVAAGDIELIEQYTQQVQDYTSLIESATTAHKAIVSKLPRKSAFIPHVTYSNMHYRKS